jgi:AbrB family looped-hinge helix DNA binding protein
MPSRTAQRAKPTGISRIGQRRQVIIPQVVLDELQLREGDLVEVTAHGGRVSMKPRKLAVVEDMLTPAEAKKVRLGLRQLKEGKTRPWNQVKNDLGL